MPQISLGKTAVPKKTRGRQGRPNVTQGEIAQMHNLKATGVTVSEIARRLGRSRATVEKHVYGKPNSWYQAEAESLHFPPPKLLAELEPEPRRLLNDFKAFRLHYFNRETPNFQLEVADRITGSMKDSDSSGKRLIFMTPPGHGKSTMVSVDLPIWLAIRARAAGERFACLLISKGETMAKAFLGDIKTRLESNAQLAKDYGWFRPEQSTQWRADAIRVDGFPADIQGKEPTFIAAGAGSAIYGWRVNLIICDDLIDDKDKDPEKTENLMKWFGTTVRSRLNKGGAIAVVGTRWYNQDLHAQICQIGGDKPVYEKISYPAHDASKCQGDCECKGACEHHPQYPDGCLLWPNQVSYEELQEIRSHTPGGSARFEFVYNQVDAADEETLIRPEWVEAAKDSTRSMWDIPRGTTLMATMDPSPTKWACAQIWAYDPSDEKRYLVAIKRAKMAVPDMIRLMEDWTVTLRERGHHATWVFEQNAAQRWLFQSLDFKLLRQRTGINVRPHDTHRNKADSAYGVQSLRNIYEFKKVSLPWADPKSRQDLQFFISELLTYPTGRTDDGVMAQWFFEWNIRKVMHNQTQPYMNPTYMPAYLKNKRKLIHIA